MRVSIIKDDNMVIVDGRAIKIDLSDFPADVHAVQWDGSTGHVEYKDKPQEKLTALDVFQTWLDRWEAERAIEDAPPPPPTLEQIKATLEAALDAYIDSVAQAKGYDSRITAALRAGYPNPWQAEGIAFGTWMDSCYSTALTIMTEVQAGTRPIPTKDELIAAMPTMVWPT